MSVKTQRDGNQVTINDSERQVIYTVTWYQGAPDRMTEARREARVKRAYESGGFGLMANLVADEAKVNIRPKRKQDVGGTA